MTKYIHLFETVENFEDYVNGSDYIEPFLCVVKGNDYNYVEYNQTEEIPRK